VQPIREPKAVEPGHLYVSHNKIDSSAAVGQDGKRIRTVPRCKDTVRSRQECDEHSSNAIIVIDNKDSSAFR
jgi:hypothetical protein